MGLLEGYFVPLYNFFLTPENFDQKVKSIPLFCLRLESFSRIYISRQQPCLKKKIYQNWMWYRPNNGNFNPNWLIEPVIQSQIAFID